jgi:hypothetical protein
LTSELHDHAERLLTLYDVEDVLQRVAEALCGDVEIGRDRPGFELIMIVRNPVPRAAPRDAQ